MGQFLVRRLDRARPRWDSNAPITPGRDAWKRLRVGQFLVRAIDRARPQWDSNVSITLGRDVRRRNTL